MNNLFTKILELIENNNIRISAHGYDELAEDGILVRDVLINVKNAVLIEQYLDYSKGPCMLVLQKDIHDKPIHVVWGIPKNADCFSYSIPS